MIWNSLFSKIGFDDFLFLLKVHNNYTPVFEFDDIPTLNKQKLRTKLPHIGRILEFYLYFINPSFNMIILKHASHIHVSADHSSMITLCKLYVDYV